MSHGFVFVPNLHAHFSVRSKVDAVGEGRETLLLLSQPRITLWFSWRKVPPALPGLDLSLSSFLLFFAFYSSGGGVREK